jgi:hypothetical protein
VRQGFRWEGDDPDLLRRVIEAAFDYRGDVTVALRSGGELRGYLANRDDRCAEPFLDLFPADGSPRRRVLYRDVRGVEFSGKDTASGKSWETWLNKWRAKKEAEARGERVGDISLYPESLD